MSRKTLLVVVAVVVAMVVVGFLVWSYLNQTKYCSVISAICGQMQNVNSAFAVYAAKANDFSALKAKAEECHKEIGNLLVSVNGMGRGVPGKYVPFHKGLQSLLNNYQTFYGKVAVEAGGWQKASFEGVETARSAVLQSANLCFTSWPGTFSPLQNDTGWCGSLSGDLKKLADSKKSASASPTMVVGGVPAAGGVIIALPSIGGQMSYNPNAGYVAQMRSLLAGYKRLRGDLDRAIQIYDSGGGIAYGTLDNAIASRRNILDAIQMIAPPPEYGEAHALAVETLQIGIGAVEGFRYRGDRKSLHGLSNIITSNMRQLQRVYGF